MYTKSLGALRKTDAAIAGGKGAALGELLYAGISVPPGFVVKTAGFRRFLRANELTQPTAQSVISANIPTEVAAEITDAYKNLGSSFVAVRSSATAEDGTAHAWAGQLESFVPTDANNLLANIKKCWASLFSPRARAYRTQAGLDDREPAIAVIVQQLIESEYAGIAFSQHPVSGDATQIVIESVQGLGEAAVGGHVTPDTYIVTKQSGEIVEKYEGSQDKKLVRGAHGEAEWQPLTHASALPPAIVQKLAAQVAAIETHFGTPMDVEWAFAHNKLYIVQSRPITA